MHDRECFEDLMEATESQKEQPKLELKLEYKQLLGTMKVKEMNGISTTNFGTLTSIEKSLMVETNFKNNAHGPTGDSILAEFAQAAIDANPDIKLYHNDYNIITQSTTANATKYKDLIQDLRDNHGVDVDGIGVQGHLGITEAKEHITDCFNILDDLGLPIKVTEFDGGNDSIVR